MTVPAEVVQLHLNHLMAVGSTFEGIVQATGLGRSTVRDIMAGKRKRVNDYTARKIREAGPAHSHKVPSAGTVRRLQALQALGWSASFLADELGVHRSRINQIMKSARVEPDTAERVKDVYKRLSMTPGPSSYARTWAAKMGYLPPLAWDDDHIDDPAAWAVGVDTDPADEYLV